MGRVTKFGMIKCRTTDIPDFQNYEYRNSERLFYTVRIFKGNSL